MKESNPEGSGIQKSDVETQLFLTPRQRVGEFRQFFCQSAPLEGKLNKKEREQKRATYGSSSSCGKSLTDPVFSNLRARRRGVLKEGRCESG